MVVEITLNKMHDKLIELFDIHENFSDVYSIFIKGPLLINNAYSFLNEQSKKRALTGAEKSLLKKIKDILVKKKQIIVFKDSAKSLKKELRNAYINTKKAYDTYNSNRIDINWADLVEKFNLCENIRENILKLGDKANDLYWKLSGLIVELELHGFSKEKSHPSYHTPVPEQPKIVKKVEEVIEPKDIELIGEQKPSIKSNTKTILNYLSLECRKTFEIENRFPAVLPPEDAAKEQKQIFIFTFRKENDNFIKALNNIKSFLPVLESRLTSFKKAVYSKKLKKEMEEYNALWRGLLKSYHLGEDISRYFILLMKKRTSILSLIGNLFASSESLKKTAETFAKSEISKTIIVEEVPIEKLPIVLENSITACIDIRTIAARFPLTMYAGAEAEKVNFYNFVKELYVPFIKNIEYVIAVLKRLAGVFYQRIKKSVNKESKYIYNALAKDYSKTAKKIEEMKTDCEKKFKIFEKNYNKNKSLEKPYANFINEKKEICEFFSYYVQLFLEKTKNQKYIEYLSWQ